MPGTELPNRNPGANCACLPLIPRRWRFVPMLALLGLSVSAPTSHDGLAQQAETSAASAASETAAANGALIKNTYEAFSRGDIDTVMASFAPDIVWHVPGRGPLSRDYRGHTEVLRFFAHFMELSGGTFRLQVDEVLAKGDRVVVLCTETARRGGRSWSAPQVHVWTIKDGKATIFREYEGDEQGDDEFWSSPG